MGILLALPSQPSSQVLEWGLRSGSKALWVDVGDPETKPASSRKIEYNGFRYEIAQGRIRGVKADLWCRTKARLSQAQQAYAEIRALGEPLKKTESGEGPLFISIQRAKGIAITVELRRPELGKVWSVPIRIRSVGEDRRAGRRALSKPFENAEDVSLRAAYRVAGIPIPRDLRANSLLGFLNAEKLSLGSMRLSDLTVLFGNKKAVRIVRVVHRFAYSDVKSVCTEWDIRAKGNDLATLWDFVAERRKRAHRERLDPPNVPDPMNITLQMQVAKTRKQLEVVLGMDLSPKDTPADMRDIGGILVIVSWKPKEITPGDAKENRAPKPRKGAGKNRSGRIQDQP